MAVILKGKIFLTTFKVTESELSFTQSFSQKLYLVIAKDFEVEKMDYTSYFTDAR